MRRRLVILIAAGLAVAAMGLSARSAIQSRHTAMLAVARFEAVSHDAQEFVSLRRATAQIASGKRPPPGIAGQISDALAEAGVSTSALAQLTPEADTPFAADTAGGASARRQSARLTLEPVTLPELGRFLQARRVRHPEWTTSSIQLSPVRDEGPRGPSPRAH